MIFGLVHRILVLALALIALTACSATGPYVWVDSLPPTATEGSLVIQDGDYLSIRVYNQDPLSGVQRVRSDGKITIPVVGEIMARGKKHAQLAAEIQDKLKGVLVAPSVTVAPETPQGAGGELKVSVLGEVKQAGNVQLDRGANVLHALAAAGGLTEYADPDKVFVIRRSLPQRVRFRFQDLRSADPKSVGFQLQSGDVIVVE
jgi:polysaccharide biosynthesis/export protein